MIIQFTIQFMPWGLEDSQRAEEGDGVLDDARGT
jgi:hypothetical protein